MVGKISNTTPLPQTSTFAVIGEKFYGTAGLVGLFFFMVLNRGTSTAKKSVCVRPLENLCK